MTVTFGIPSLRPLGLVLVGTLLGALLVAPVAAQDGSPTAVESTTPQKRSVSCQGLNFHPIDDETGYAFRDTLLVRSTGHNSNATGSGYFECDPGLPHEAVVTKVQFTVHDMSPTADIRFCALSRSGLTATTVGRSQVMGQVLATGLAQTPGTLRRSDTSITNPKIDNINWSYWLQCQIHWDSIVIENGQAGIYGANVVYTISSSDG